MSFRGIRDRRAQAAFWGLVFAGLALMAAQAALGIGGEPLAGLVDGPLPAAITVAVAVGGLLRALAAPAGTRAPWIVLALALCAYAAGNIYFLLAAPDSSSYPTPGDGFLLGFYALTFAALWLLIRQEGGGPQITLWLDAAIVALAVGAVLLELLLSRSAGGIDRALIGGTIANVMLDQLLLAVALIAATLNRSRLDSAFPLLALGALMLTVTDAFYLRHLTEGDTAMGVGLDLGWTAAIATIGIAGWRKLSVPTERVRETKAFYIAVGFAFVLALGVLVNEYLDTPDPAVIVVAALVPVLVFVRLLLMLRENDRLARDNMEMIAAIGEGLFRSDLEGRITFANPAAARMAGWSPEQMVGRNGHELLHHHRPDGSPYPAEECPIQRALKQGQTRRLTDQSFCRRDGSVFPVTLTAAPVREAGKVTGAVVVFDDVTAERTAADRLRHEAEHDSLTGLVNRRRFIDELGAQIQSASETNEAGAVVLIDIDHFKFVNDSLGHLAGDEVLCSIAEALRRRISAGDVVARIGGDEFAILLRRSAPPDALATAEELISVATVSPKGPPVGLSAGVASFNGSETVSADELLIAADIALYQAKERGRGNAVPYGGTKGTSLTWIERIREAMADQRLVLYAQPIVDLETGETAREELLLRMLDEHGDAIAPGSFLPTAERFGLMREIDRLVVGKAVELADGGRTVSVNVSGRSIGDSRLLALVEAAVARGVPPANLWFEITETAAIANLDHARRFAERLVELGCSVVLDDFGTGFGSLTYLKHVPIRCLKIDIDFVSDITTNPVDRRIVATIVRIARGQGHCTVAEGVEDEATLVLLRKLGVDYAQGYHLGRPAPAEPARAQESPDSEASDPPGAQLVAS